MSLHCHFALCPNPQMRSIFVAVVFFSCLLHSQGAAEALEYRVLANHRVVPTVDVVHLQLSSTWQECIAACEASRKYFFLLYFVTIMSFTLPRLARCHSFTWAAKMQNENSCGGPYRCIVYDTNPSFSLETSTCSVVGLVT